MTPLIFTITPSILRAALFELIKMTASVTFGKIRFFAGLVFCLAFLGAPVHAIHIMENDHPYGQPMDHALDEPLNTKFNGKAFFMNLGPTGIRARIDPDAPKEFKVQYVFKGSPADGKINPGDHIVGANGKEFVVAHGFHRKEPTARGWQGPPFELALAIEDSQGKDGKLTLMVKGKSGKQNVVIQIKAVGRFSPTYPWNCSRSDQLRKDLVDFLLKEGTKGMMWIQIQKTLALWASGDERAIPLAKELGQQIAKSRQDPMAEGMVSWTWGYLGIFLGEYYRAFNDKAAVEAAKNLIECYETGQTYSNGGFSHRPFPAIERRVAEGGPKGYGAMAGPGGLSMLAQSIFREVGLPISELAYNRTHQAYLGTCGESPNGGLAYGFDGKSRAVYIRLANPSTSPCKSKVGIGFHCPTGMKNIGPFKVENWTQTGEKWNMALVAPSGEFSWVNDLGTRVYDLGTDRRLVVQPLSLQEPKKPFNNDRKGGGHVAPVGMGALAHFIGNKGNTPWNYLGAHMALHCASSPKTLWDGHACAPMHAFFGVLGASRAEEKDLRSFLDYSKTWIILSETHEDRKVGGLVEQPFGCDRVGTCLGKHDRTIFSHVALLLLSLPKKNLLITGAPTYELATFNILQTIQDASFSINHCKKESDMLEKGSSYLSVLKSLRSQIKKEGEVGIEAQEFYNRVKGWLIEETEQRLAKSQSAPAQSLGELETWIKEVKGLPPEDLVEARIKAIKEYKGSRDFLNAYKTHASIEATIAKSGVSKNTDTLKEKLKSSLEKLIEKNDAEPVLIAEAQSFLTRL